MKTVCQLDQNGFYIGLTEADPSPLEPGVYLLPAGAVDVEAPALVPDGYRALLNAEQTGWDFVSVEPTVAPQPEPASAAQRLADLTRAIQRQLDAFSATRGYDNLLSACSYATSTVPRFAAEGQYCLQLRDQTWAQCYAILDAVNSGQRPEPTLADLLAELPTPEWPA